MAEREADRKQAEETDFWGTPASVYTVEDRSAMVAIAWELEEIAKAGRELEAVAIDIGKAEMEVDRIVGARVVWLRETEEKFRKMNELRIGMTGPSGGSFSMTRVRTVMDGGIWRRLPRPRSGHAKCGAGLARVWEGRVQELEAEKATRKE